MSWKSLRSFVNYISTLLIIFCLNSSPSYAEFELVKESIGPYFISLGVTNQSTGGGLDDVFSVEFRRLYPRSAELKNAIDNVLGDLTDSGDYTWRERHGEWRLYKSVPGTRQVRLEIVGLVFPASRKLRYKMEMFKANPGLYKSANLEHQLEVLGVMGILARGNSLTVDFIREWSPPVGSDGFPLVYTSNIGSMLKLYAYQASFDGMPSIPHPLNSDPGLMGSPAILNDILALELEGPQKILDDWVPATPNTNPEHILSEDQRKIPNEIAGVELTPAMNIAYIYLPYRASGNGNLGSPKAMFVPMGITGKRAWDSDNKKYYPIFVFPPAFGSRETMEAGLVRELYHAQWWNAVANLPDAENDLREFLMRTTLPHLEYDIYKVMNSGYTTDNTGTATLIFGMNMAKNFLDPIKKIRNAPPLIENPWMLQIPWTVSNDLIIPQGTVLPDTPNTPQTKLWIAGDICYNNAVLLAGENDNDESRWLPYAAFKSTPNGANTIALNENIKTKLVAELLSAIASGHTRSKEMRSANFSVAIGKLGTDLDSAMKNPIIGGALARIFGADYEPTTTLLDGIKSKTFRHDDIKWLHKAGDKFFDIQDNFLKGLKAFSDKFKTIDKLYLGPDMARALFTVERLSDIESRFTELATESFNLQENRGVPLRSRSTIADKTDEFLDAKKAFKNVSEMYTKKLGAADKTLLYTDTIGNTPTSKTWKKSLKEYEKRQRQLIDTMILIYSDEIGNTPQANRLEVSKQEIKGAQRWDEFVVRQIKEVFADASQQTIGRLFDNDKRLQRDSPWKISVTTNDQVANTP